VGGQSIDDHHDPIPFLICQRVEPSDDLIVKLNFHLKMIAFTRSSRKSDHRAGRDAWTPYEEVTAPQREDTEMSNVPRPPRSRSWRQIQVQPPTLITMTAEQRERAVRAVAALLLPQIRAERQAADSRPEATEEPEASPRGKEFSPGGS